MEAFQVNVKRPLEFLESVLGAFAHDEDAKVSLEGELRLLGEASLVEVSRDETTCLRRQTLEPEQDFVVIALSGHTLHALVSLCGRLGVRTRVTHVQIESGGVLVFGAYDNFDPSGVWISTRFRDAILLRLQKQGVIASYELVSEFRRSNGTAESPADSCAADTPDNPTVRRRASAARRNHRQS